MRSGADIPGDRTFAHARTSAGFVTGPLANLKGMLYSPATRQSDTRPAWPQAQGMLPCIKGLGRRCHPGTHTEPPPMPEARELCCDPRPLNSFGGRALTATGV